MHFALWCLFGVPLMMGGDIRSLNDFSRNLLLNRELIALNQDEECRAPYLADQRDNRYFFVRHLADNEFALAYINMADSKTPTYSFCGSFADIGLPVESGYGLELTDMFTGENIGVKSDYFNPEVAAHDCKLYHAKLVALK